MNERNPVLALATMAGILSLSQIYGQFAPPLSELRKRDTANITGRQELMDADIIVGIIAGIAGGFASYATHSIGPFLILMGVFSIISGWHHMVLNGTNAHVERLSA